MTKKQSFFSCQIYSSSCLSYWAGLPFSYGSPGCILPSLDRIRKLCPTLRAPTAFCLHPHCSHPVCTLWPVAWGTAGPEASSSRLCPPVPSRQMQMRPSTSLTSPCSFLTQIFHANFLLQETSVLHWLSFRRPLTLFHNCSCFLEKNQTNKTVSSMSYGQPFHHRFPSREFDTEETDSQWLCVNTEMISVGTKPCSVGLVLSMQRLYSDELQNDCAGWAFAN